MFRFCSVFLAVFLASPLIAQGFTGVIAVVDADTLWVDDIKVRLYGIDAPEIGQNCELADGRAWACGHWAKSMVVQLYDGALAVCDPLELDRYRRVVARCRVDGADIGDRLVRLGIAEAYRKYALDYVDAEKSAFFSGVGLWRGRVQAPADFRAVQNAVRNSVPPPNPDCAIKGNISGNGRIYHLPGQAFYAQTVIQTSVGERWFCSEAAARAAGWRKARR